MTKALKIKGVNPDKDITLNIHTNEKNITVKSISELMSTFVALYQDKELAKTDDEKAKVDETISKLKSATADISASWKDVEEALEAIVYELMYQQKEQGDKLDAKINILFRALKYSRSISNKSIKSVEEQFDTLDKEKSKKEEN